ncbi:hypothetical protein [Marinospirillum perlucidum]|uniref:hypothetical protein n=1 Tax=Marinospirillum perlucidum TaxID=1982602 RepID=UPI000DF39365|nr:hypothetical protein [Marinospirillum perlucidum]
MLRSKFALVGLALLTLTACGDSDIDTSSASEAAEDARSSFEELASKLTGEGQERLEEALGGAWSDLENLREDLSPEQIQARLSEEFEGLSGEELRQAVEEYRDELQQ